jgi:hypothetical protein
VTAPTESERLRAYKAFNDALETPADKEARIRKELLRAARKSLQGLDGKPALKRVLGIILDELESRP